MKRKENKTVFVYYTLRKEEFEPIVKDLIKKLNKDYSKDVNSILTLFFKFLVNDESLILSFIKDFLKHQKNVGKNLYEKEEVENFLVKKYINDNAFKGLNPLVMYNYTRKLKSKKGYIRSENYYPIKIEKAITKLVEALGDKINYKNPRGTLVGYYARWGLTNEQIKKDFIDFCKKYEIFIYHKS